jgi:putative transposase
MDFSEFETALGGIWRICAVIDYATKYCLAATVTPTSRGQMRSVASAGPTAA